VRFSVRGTDITKDFDAINFFEIRDKRLVDFTVRFAAEDHIDAQGSGPLNYGAATF
jgi:hypothetical protein